jgi:hypothetical protein
MNNHEELEKLTVDLNDLKRRIAASLAIIEKFGGTPEGPNWPTAGQILNGSNHT